MWPHLPGTAGGDPAAVTQDKASGDPALQMGWDGPQGRSAQPLCLCQGGHRAGSHIL